MHQTKIELVVGIFVLIGLAALAYLLKGISTEESLRAISYPIDQSDTERAVVVAPHLNPRIRAAKTDDHLALDHPPFSHQ